MAHMNLRDGIKHSCDVFFYETARRIGIDTIAAMASSWASAPRPASTCPASAPA